MKRSIAIIFWCLWGFIQCFGQGPCTTFVPSTRTASISISSSVTLFYDGQSVPNGSRVVAVDEDGNCASDFITWTGADTTFLVNGEDVSTEGFKDGELIQFYLALNDSCFVETGTLIYDTSMSATAGNFEEDETFDIIFLSFENNFEPEIIDVVQSSCDSLNGSFSISIDGGFGPFSYEWSHDSLLVDSLASGLSVGDYMVTITDTYGCPQLVEGNIIANPAPIAFEFEIDSTGSVCDSVILSNGLDCFNCAYFWSNGPITEFNQINAPGTYSVLVTNGACSARDTIEINFAAAPVLLASIGQNQICPGDTLELFASGAINYLWESNAEIINPTDSNSFAVITENSSIQLSADNVCTAVNDSFEVTVFSLPEAGEAQCVALNNNGIQLNAGEALSYFWEFNEIGPVSDDQISNPTASPTENTFYVVNFVDSNGCESSDSISVEVIEDIIAATPLYNIITPNNDGKNDVLFFDKLEISSESELIVYNRWGKVVFQQVGYTNDWGGTSDGSLLPAGSYHYVLNVNGTLLKSNLTIVYE